MIGSSIFIVTTITITMITTISVTSASTFSREIELKWEEYKRNNQRTYHSWEEVVRKEFFLRTHFSIEDHNQDVNKYYVKAHNQFSDMSMGEKQSFLGLRGDKTISPIRFWTRGIFSPKLPLSLDYRSDKCLQPVKYQRGCGACWAFTAIAPLEFSRCKATGISLSLSEQQLIDCDTVNKGCSGGWYDDAWEYLKGGSNLDQKYGPYIAQKKSCTAKSEHNRAYVASYEWVDPNPVAMMKALQDGPLAVAFQVVDSFYNYKEGIYFGLFCKETVNHSVVIVGYGSMFGIPYWICRNSWGQHWGSGGYFLIMRGVNMCNIEKYPAKVTAKVRRPKEF